MNDREIQRRKSGNEACRHRYERPRVEETAEFETLALACVKDPGTNPDCLDPGGAQS